MVAMGDDGGHVHDDDQGDELCPRCVFVERLGDYLDAAAHGAAAEWQDATGGIIDAMHGALWALHRLRAEATTDYGDEIDNVGEAARALATLGEIVVRLEQRLRP